MRLRILLFLLLLFGTKCHASYSCTLLRTGEVLLPPVIDLQRESTSPWYETGNPALAKCVSDGLGFQMFSVMVMASVGSYMYDGANYNLYSTGIKEISFIVEFFRYSDSAWVPVTASSAELLTLSGKLNTVNLGGRSRIKFVSSSGSVPAGSYSIPSIGFMRSELRSGVASAIVFNGGITRTTASSLAVKAKSCTLKSPGVVKLPRADFSQFKAVGTTAGESPFQFAVDCSDAFVDYSVSFYMTDVNDPANTSTALAQTSNSGSASGIAIEVLDGLTPVTFGPQLTAENKRRIGTITMAGGSLVKPLTSRYKRTNAVVTPGPLSAGVTITLVYE